MNDENEDLEKIVLTKLMYLDAVIVGLVAGLILGWGIFFATNFLILKDGEVVGPHLALLGQFFIGYKVTFIGSLYGLAYGFISGFGIGYIIARLYNWFASLRENSHG